MRRYGITATKQYKKDYKRLIKSGFDVRKLEAVIDQLASGSKLADRHHDHALRGELKQTRECHIGPDWLLRYCKDDDQLVLLLICTGTHRDVLGIE